MVAIGTDKRTPKATGAQGVKKDRAWVRSRPAVVLGSLGVFAVLFGTWELASRLGIVNPLFMGTPSEIFQRFFEQLGSSVLTEDAFATTVGSLVGFAGASVLAVVTAFLLTQRPYLFRIVEPLLTAFNSMPRVALAPLILLWFGIGLSSKIVLAASLAFFVVFSNTVAGIQSVSEDHVIAARTMGASSSEVFRKVVLPSAVPSIFTGLELGYIYGMLGTVAGEMIAGENGLGVRLQYFASSFRMNDYFATLFLLVIITMILAGILRAARLRLLAWQQAGGVSR